MATYIDPARVVASVQRLTDTINPLFVDFLILKFHGANDSSAIGLTTRSTQEGCDLVLKVTRGSEAAAATASTATTSPGCLPSTVPWSARSISASRSAVPSEPVCALPSAASSRLAAPSKSSRAASARCSARGASARPRWSPCPARPMRPAPR